MDLITPYISRLLANENPIILAYGLLILAFFFRVSYLLSSIQKKIDAEVARNAFESKKKDHYIARLWRKVYGGDDPPPYSPPTEQR